MSAFRSLQQGIAAIREGKPEEGARLLRFALRDPAVAGSLRATGYMWLAETTRDTQEKIDCYTEALSADPTNELAQQRLSLLLAPPAPGQEVMLSDYTPTSNPLVTPPPPPPVYQPPGVTLTAQPAAVQPPPRQTAPTGAYHIVGVYGGLSEPGSGFFVTRSGLIATTRHVVGSQPIVNIELPNRRQVPGRVVRAFPEIDVAFVHVEQNGGEPMPVSPYALIPASMPLKAFSFNGRMVEGSLRETGRLLAPHWFPTDMIRVPDAGGNPVLDEQRYLVGMLTRNISSSTAYVFGVHITAIQRCLDAFSNEMRSDPNRVYCPACGGVSRAAGAGGYYCELCGATMPHAADNPRLLIPQIAALYHENPPAACTHCGGQAGTYHGRCLRCGRETTRSAMMTTPL